MKQPEALRLADDCDEGMVNFENAAAELRRLHEVNKGLIHLMKYIQVQTHIGHIHDTASVAISKAEKEQP